MKKIIINSDNIPNIEKNVACIGYFDAVHKGHQKLIKKTIQLSKKYKVKSCVICFEPDPINVIAKKNNKHVLSYKNRLLAFEYFGIDLVIIIKFDKNLMKLSSTSFINKYLKKFNIVELVCGFDYTFGYKGLGNCKQLIDKCDFNITVIGEIKYQNKKISTTRIKESILEGNFRLVNKLLGWEYLIDLKVVNSIKKANKWLIEAKLADIKCILPKDGNYNGIIIENDTVYITGNSKLERNQRLFLTFDE